jgi:hypothetical protein
MTKPGTDAESIARTEADHFMKCPGCGAWFDMRDLGAVLDHERPLPHPAAIRRSRGGTLVLLAD